MFHGLAQRCLQPRSIGDITFDRTTLAPARLDLSGYVISETCCQLENDYGCAGFG
jgi:hypothetical protein